GMAPSATAAVFGAPPAEARQGIAVVAMPAATDAAWPLARAVYAEPSLRPSTLDDATARVLCGEPATERSPPSVLELAEMVAALRGDDAPTRALLGAIGGRLSVRAMLVVRAPSGGAVSALLFLSDTGAFDAAKYEPDDPTPPLRWTGASRSLARSFFGAASGGGPSVPALATHASPDAQPRRRAFYESGWFWGALGAAVLGGGAAFLATRDSSAPSIHLQVQVPR
ncbi:MAG: hypothetical protein M3O50_22505, partial [Myxococcota bacterium]|nr:hypothetical protein [Myxococcota bacterium]